MRRTSLVVVGAISMLACTAVVFAPTASAASAPYSVTEVPVSETADAVAADPAINTVYAATGGPAVAVINGATKAVTPISLTDVPTAIAVDTSSDTVYAISSSPPAVTVINGATNTVTGSPIALPARLQSIAAAVNPTTHWLYVADSAHGTVVAVNSSVTPATVQTIALATSTAFPQGVAVDSTTNTIYVAEVNADRVETIDGTATDSTFNTVTGQIALPSGSAPEGVAADPSTADATAGMVYVADTGRGAISTIDTLTGNSVSTLASGLTGPFALALDAGAGVLYATDLGNTDGLGLGITYAINPSGGAITTQIPRGGRSVAVAASGGSAFVDGNDNLGDYGGDVTVITLGTPTTSMSPVVATAGLACPVGQSCAVTLQASGAPAATFSATGLPAWLSLSGAVLSGSPPAGSGGTSSVAVTATNGVAPSDTVNLPVTVYEAPTITSASTASFSAGLAGSFAVTASGYPASTFSETGTLPNGVTLGSNGVLAGAPLFGGNYPITVTANNGIGANATQNLTLSVSGPAIPTVPPAVLNDTNGTLSLYEIRGDGNVWADAQSAVGGVYNGWQQLSSTGNFAGTPAVIETNSGIIGIYARTTSGAIMGASQSAPGGAPSAWSQIGSAADLVSSPTVLLTPAGIVAIYGSDSGGTIEGISQFAANSAFGNWQTLSPNDGFAGRPAVIQTKSGVIAIYATTSGHTILGTSQQVVGGAFSAWGQLGSATDVVSDPWVLLTSSGVIAAYAADTAGEIEGVSQFAPFSAFGSWQALSPDDGFSGRAAVLQTSTGAIAIYARSSAGTVLGTSQSVAGGSFSAWSEIGTAANLVSDPAALITNSSHVIAMFAFGTSGVVAGTNQSGPFGPFVDWIDI